MAASLVALAFVGMAAGCGDAYRATVGTGYPVPVPTQPEYLPLVISAVESPVQCALSPLDAGCASSGTGTIFDAAGDSTVANVVVGNQPVAAALSAGGSAAYVINLGSYDTTSAEYQGSVSSFVLSTSPQPGQVSTTTLDNAGDVYAAPGVPSSQTTPCSATATAPTVFADANLIYASQTTSPVLLPLSRNVSGTGVPTLIGTLPTAGIVTNFAGQTNSYLSYAIEQGANEVQIYDSTQASATTQPTLRASLTSGFSAPFFGVTSSDGNYVFVLNCNATVTAINARTLSTSNIIPLPGGAGNPVWGDFVNSENLLVVASTTEDQTGTNSAPTQGSLTVINAVENTDQFGQIEGSVAVGINPSGVAVLQESAGSTSRAYVANDGDDDVTDTVPITPTTTAPCDCKTVSVVPMGINGTPGGPAYTIPLSYSQLDVTGTSYTTETCPANPVLENGYPFNAASATGYPLQIVATPDTVDQQVFVLCNQPSEDGSYYVFAIRTYALAGTSGSTSAGDVVAAAIPVVGVPTQLKIAPSR